MKHRSKVLFIVLVTITLNTQASLAQVNKEIVITINDFFYESSDTVSDLDYASNLVRVIASANDRKIPLHLFVDPSRSSYIQDGIELYLESSDHRLGTLGKQRTLTLAEEAPPHVIPSTYRFRNDKLLAEFREFEANEDDEVIQAFIGEYADLFLESFMMQDSLVQEAIGLPFTNILTFEMNALNAVALPVIWQKMAELGYRFVQVEEALQDSTIQLLSKDGLQLDSLFQNPQTKFSLKDFYGDSPWIKWRTEALFNSLNDQQRVGQMFVVAAGVLGKPDGTVDKLVEEGNIGGVILLKGSVKDFAKRTHRLDSINSQVANLPLLYSADAEPSLINMKIAGLPKKIKRTNKHTSTGDVDSTTVIISDALKDLGILHNYAPVADMSPNNKAIGNRTFGNDPELVKELCNTFIKASQDLGIAATVKHFPGHGYVKGDSHHVLPVIDGEMQEAPIYQSFIDSGVISIMVGHIAVKNNKKYNTNGLPASCSRAIITDLLKDKMGFKGIVITDALRMGGVISVPQAPLKSAKAGSDMLLMVQNEEDAIASILNEIVEDQLFKQQVYDSVRKIIRLKLSLGVIKSSPIFDEIVQN